VCAASLAREARLELALGEVHAFRAAHHTKSRRLLVRLAPVLAFAAAAAVLVALRRSPPPGDVQPDPSARAVAPAAAAASSTPSDTAEVIATLRPRFKACYPDSLRASGATDGKVVLLLKIDAEGNVLDVIVDSNTGLSPEMTACLVEVLHGARFAATGKPTTISVPIAFTSQR